MYMFKITFVTKRTRFVETVLARSSGEAVAKAWYLVGERKGVQHVNVEQCGTVSLESGYEVG